jgi:cytochrome c553
MLCSPPRGEKKMVRNLFIALAAFALLGLASPAGAAGDADAGKTKATNCAACHGADGLGMGPNPPLAGMSAEAHVKAMLDYKTGEREHPMMQKLATTLSDEDINDIAAYYATLK